MVFLTMMKLILCVAVISSVSTNYAVRVPVSTGKVVVALARQFTNMLASTRTITVWKNFHLRK